MNKIRKKFIIKAYKSLDNLDINLNKNYYYVLAIYAEEFFEKEWESFALGNESLYINEEGIINYEAFFHTLFLNQSYIYDYKGNKQGFYGKYYFCKNRAYLEFI